MSRISWIAMLLLAPLAHAELTIFDVRKNLPLSDDEKVYRDFYINGGTESGVAVGMVITVQRRLPLYDTYQNRSAGDLDLKVAKIKVIHVQKGLSVARLHSEYSRENAPLLEDNFIMVGDRLDLATAVQDRPDKKAGEPESKAPDTAAAPQEPSTAFIPRGQIIVNSIDISSSSAKATAQAQGSLDNPIN